jgi:hypothetical protein
LASALAWESAKRSPAHARGYSSVGLNENYGGQLDRRPVVDTRALLKGVASGVFDLTGAHANRIFPGSSDVAGLWDLLL